MFFVLLTVLPAENKNRDDQIEELIEKMALGDISAVGELYQLIKTGVYAFALSKTANKSEAEDVTHDTFVQVWKNAKKYISMGKPLAWIFTIETNLIRKQYNKKQRLLPLEESLENESDGYDFTQTVINNEFLRQIMHVLSSEEREIIALHVGAGLKHKEIAFLLKKPLSTVLSRYNRAIKKLQAQVLGKENG